jgi:hypothetical protein
MGMKADAEGTGSDEQRVVVRDQGRAREVADK